MSKKIKDENGNVYVQKKPFYKKVWFWLLVVIVVICAGGALGGGDVLNRLIRLQLLLPKNQTMPTKRFPRTLNSERSLMPSRSAT